MPPLTAIAAACHSDPYPYYQRLLAGPDLVFDTGLQLWIASRAAVICDIMSNSDCVVRPASQPVPDAIAGSSAGAVFSRLARMSEGPAHEAPKRALSQLLAAVDHGAVARRTRQLAPMLGSPDGAALTKWMFDLPTCVVADMLGVGGAELPQVARWVADFVRCLSPLSTPGQLASASDAAQALMERFASLPASASLHNASALGHEVVVANLIGLLSQTHDATAGLVGNSITALLAQPQLQARLRADPGLAGAFVREVARYDPAIQNTRRFVARATTVAGEHLQPGDTLLLLLGAAARDSEANPQAGVFLLERDERQQSGFGFGRHACPGQELAFTIATGAMHHLLALAHPLDAAALCWSYAPSANARLPQFSTAIPKGQP